MKLKENGTTPALLGCGLAMLTAVAFAIYGAVYPVYFDVVVLLCVLLGAAGLAGYVFGKKLTAFLNLAAVLFLSFGLALFAFNSYPVWADWYGKFNMYGSQGGVTPVIIQIILLFAAIVCGIVSCFHGKEAKE